MQPSAYMDRVRGSRPLVHHITNYVTVNDCANITICAGGSPVMADQESDATDIAAVSSCLVINMGTVNERTFASMLAAGKAANENGVPVVFDPVGAGASRYRDRESFRRSATYRDVARHKISTNISIPASPSFRASDIIIPDPARGCN